jgi:hypothetical protein
MEDQIGDVERGSELVQRPKTSKSSCVLNPKKQLQTRMCTPSLAHFQSCGSCSSCQKQVWPPNTQHSDSESIDRATASRLRHRRMIFDKIYKIFKWLAV